MNEKIGFRISRKDDETKKRIENITNILMASNPLQSSKAAIYRHIFMKGLDVIEGKQA